VKIKERDSECLSTSSFKTFKDKRKVVHINQYKILKTLGQGSYGIVKKVLDTKNNQVYAMKSMMKSFLKKQKIGASNAYESVKAELEVLQKLEHPNIIYLREIIDDPTKDDLHIVT